MYAVVEVGGHQYKVRENQVIYVNRLPDAEGTITLDKVLLVSDDKEK